MMDTSRRNGRRKLLHRFYEPLALLYSLDKIQGEKSLRPGSGFMPLAQLSEAELRREFVDALCYACDFEKGGDTTTAMKITECPLTYNMACNKSGDAHVQKAKQHLAYIFGELVAVYDLSSTDAIEVEDRLLSRCVTESNSRLELYRKSLFMWLDEGIKNETENREDLCNLKALLQKDQDGMKEFCILCHRLMSHTQLNFLRQQIERSRQRGDQHCVFDKIRHHIGRIAYHVRIVKILLEAGRRLPRLFESPDVHFIKQEKLHDAMPQHRDEATLDAIALRMLPAKSPMLSDIQRRLQELDRTLGVDKTIRTIYRKPSFKPIMHAEMIVLEYLHSQGDEIDLGQDRYIGCSKPACFCCFLYMQHHPGRFEQPATHQKLYFNWMPPTNVPGVSNVDSSVAKHEKLMMNKMVASVRAKLFEQITTRSGRRKQHFDSVTGDPFVDTIARDAALPTLAVLPELDDNQHTTASADGSIGNLVESSVFVSRLQAVDLADEDSEGEGGGVSLTSD